MEEIGEILKQARIEKGYTLDDLQQITKIQKKYLEAIENGNTEILPGRFYARAFVKQYADIVELNGEELLEKYDETSTQEVNEEFAESMSSSPTRTKIEKDSVFTGIREQLPTILIFILVATILIVIYFAFRKTGVEETDSTMISDEQNEELINSENEEVEEEKPEEETEKDETEEETEEETESEEEENKESEEEQKFEVANSTGNMTDYEVRGPHPEEQSIVLSTDDGESWVSIKVDGETIESTTLAVNSSVTVDFTADTERVDLRIGNAKATSISLNDKDLGYGENSQGTVQNMVINFTE